tara:strand:+ start:13785 stop:14030 length:246 start_codon:yes stop_codon:yes gene_type:complete
LADLEEKDEEREEVTPQGGILTHQEPRVAAEIEAMMSVRSKARTNVNQRKQAWRQFAYAGFAARNAKGLGPRGPQQEIENI